MGRDPADRRGLWDRFRYPDDRCFGQHDRAGVRLSSSGIGLSRTEAVSVAALIGPRINLLTRARRAAVPAGGLAAAESRGLGRHRSPSCMA